MKHVHKLPWGGALLLCLAGSVTPAPAQSVSELYSGTVVTLSPAERDAVRNRPQEDYDPVGGRISSFFIYPWLEDLLLYNDNIYATNRNRVSDLANVVNGGFNARSNFSRHALSFRFAFENFNYVDETSQDHFDAEGVAQWRLDLADGLEVTGSVLGRRDHLDPGAIDSPEDALEPVPYNQLQARTTVKKRFNRVTGSVTGTIATISYENVKARNGGTVRQDFRDGETYTLQTKWAYEFSPGYAAFAMLEGNIRDYDRHGYNRSSEGLMALAGVEFDVTALMHGELGFGYLTQDYDSAGVRDIDGWAMRAALVYNPTTLITLNAVAERRIGETIQVGASGRLDTLFKISADYELLRNFILSPYLGYIHSDYEGSGRKDGIFEAGLKADYLFNRNLSASLLYEFRDRDSNVGKYDFSRNYAGIGLKARF